MTKKQEVIEVAIRLFLDKGFTSTTVDDIVKESSLAKASFYKLFESKDALLEEIFDQFVVLHQEINQYIQTLSTSSSRERLECFCRIAAESISQNNHLFVNTLRVLSTTKAELFVTFEMKAIRLMGDMLLSIYGSAITPYLYDIVLVHMALFRDYVMQVSHTPPSIRPQFWRFLADMTDMAVTYFRETRQGEAIITPLLKHKLEAVSINPVEKAKQIAILLNLLQDSILQDSSTDQQLKKELLEVLHHLERECEEDRPRITMIKPLLSYLAGYSEMRDLCDRLSRLLTPYDGVGS